MAIEVELPPADVTEVSYDDEFVFMSNFLNDNDIEGAARAALSKKYAVWRHEEEVRLVTEEAFYKLPEPTTG